MKPKAIIFDCFGVVISPVVSNWLDKNLDSKKVFDRVNFLKRFDLNEVSEEGLTKELSSLVDRPSEVIQNEIDGHLVFNLETVSYLKELKSRGYKIILLTNANHGFFERFIFTQHPWFSSLFDDIVISSKIKMVKPDKDIFLYTLDKNNLKANEAVFIDDGEANVRAAESVGIKSFLFKNALQVQEELNKYL